MKAKKEVPPETIDRLLEAVERLAGEVQVLREVLDRLEEGFDWAIKNDKLRCSSLAPPMIITSMPRNPCAPDFGERINRFRPEDLPPENDPAEEEEPAGVHEQGQLF